MSERLGADQRPSTWVEARKHDVEHDDVRIKEPDRVERLEPDHRTVTDHPSLFQVPRYEPRWAARHRRRAPSASGCPCLESATSVGTPAAAGSSAPGRPRRAARPSGVDSLDRYAPCCSGAGPRSRTAWRSRSRNWTTPRRPGRHAHDGGERRRPGSRTCVFRLTNQSPIQMAATSQPRGKRVRAAGRTAGRAHRRRLRSRSGRSASSGSTTEPAISGAPGCCWAARR